MEIVDTVITGTQTWFSGRKTRSVIFFLAAAFGTSIGLHTPVQRPDKTNPPPGADVSTLPSRYYEI